MQAHLDAGPPAAPKLRLFNADGSLRVPDVQASAPTADALTHRDVLPYRSTRLEGAWVRKNETLGGEMLRKATVSHRWRNRYGTQVQCFWMLVLGGCNWGHEAQASIEELQRMRADPPAPKPSP